MESQYFVMFKIPFKIHSDNWSIDSNYAAAHISFVECVKNYQDVDGAEIWLERRTTEILYETKVEI